MVAREIKLISPNDRAIVGLLLEDGTVCPAVFMYDPERLVSNIILQDPHSSPPKKMDGSSVYVDESGGLWNSVDIEYHSILKG